MLQLAAPDQILVNEVGLLVDAIRLLAPMEWAKREIDHQLMALKPAWGFCAEPGCQSRIVDGDLDVCPEHTEESDDVLDETDDADVMDFIEESASEAPMEAVTGTPAGDTSTLMRVKAADPDDEIHDHDDDESDPNVS